MSVCLSVHPCFRWRIVSVQAFEHLLTDFFSNLACALDLAVSKLVLDGPVLISLSRIIVIDFVLELCFFLSAIPLHLKKSR